MNREDRAKTKAWKRHQKAEAQRSFPLAEDALQDLFEHLTQELAANGCNHTNRYTLGWISEHDFSEDDVISWAQEHGGYCDCEVLGNTGDHFDQNRADS